MKLYSKKAVIVIAGISFLSAAMLIAAGSFIIARTGIWSSRSAGTGGSPAALSAPPLAASTTQPASGQITETALSDSGYTLDEMENISIYERYNESVVNITTEVMALNWFLDPVPQSGGSGSGSIIDEKGYVLTNNHVVKDAYKLYVNLADGSRHEATVVGTDPQNDLAVIKFSPPAGAKLKPIPFGTSKNLKVGQKVLAIGNPFGLERTLTKGIISGLGRPIQKDSSTILQNMIQTDASINPGNSGGPLLNARGEMIGINTMIYSPSGGSVGIGFAIPVDTAVRIVPELIKEGKVRRGWIDMDAFILVPDLVEYMRKAGYSVPVEKGLLVSQVRPGSNAEKAGLRGGTKAVRYGSSVFNIGGDIIISVDNQEIASVADLYTALEDNKPGEKVWVEFYRGNQKNRVQVTLIERTQNE